MDVRTYDIGAYGTVRQDVHGRFFKLVETRGPVVVQLLRGGSPIGEVGRDVLGGYSVFTPDWRDPAPLFDGFIITSVTPQTITVATSMDPGEYDRAVSQVDIQQSDSVTFRNGDASTAASIAYEGGGKAQPVSGKYTAIQLWNPAGSGKTGVVDLMTVSPSSGQAAGWDFTATALTGSAFYEHNKRNGLLGLPSPSLLIRTQQLTASVINGGFPIGGTTIGTNAVIPFTAPLMIEEGYGLVVQTEAVTVTLKAYFQWREY